MISQQPAFDVSIIIPYHNCAAMTRACLESIARHTPRVTFEVILVDDASTEQPQVADLKSSLNLRVIRNASRQSYSANNNQAAKEARGELLCLLNNDTLVTPNWLSPMVDLIRREPAIGVLGNKHLFPKTELLHHCGMAYDQTGFPLHMHPHTNPKAPAVNYQRDVPCVTFACVMIPSRIYAALGGLDEAYKNGFEDCDFCERARRAGHRITYTPASVIYHFGQSSTGRTDHENANAKLFKERWGAVVSRTLEETLRADNAYNEALAKKPRLRAVPGDGLHLMLNVNEPSAFTWAGVDLAIALQRAGMPITLPVSASVHKSIPAAKARVLKAMRSAKPRGTFHVKWSHYWPQYMSQVLAGEVNAEFFCTNYRYREEGRHLDLWMRHVQVNEYRKLAITQFNRSALLEIGVPDRDCRVMQLGYSPEIDTLFPSRDLPSRSKDGDLHILLVTNSGDLYRYGTDLAVEALSQAFSESDPVIIHIKDYGQATDKTLEGWIKAKPRFPRVQWHREFLEKEDLLKLYASMDLQLAPFRGEGFSMKLIDGMAVGLPALFPKFGGPADFALDGSFIPLAFDEVPVGACYDRDHAYIGEGAYWCQVRVEDMVAKLNQALKDRASLPDMGLAALKHVRAGFSWDHAAAQMIESLKSWSADRLATVAPRRHPDQLPMTVIIPTKDRNETLDMTLAAYQKQTLPRSDFELLLVNDHGDLPSLEKVIEKHSARLPIRVLDNHGPGGPAAARNLAICQSKGGVVLITGDDIVPGEGFLKEHLDGHRRYPHLESALVGLTLWHPDLPASPFQDYITGKGGMQFAYNDMKDNQPVPFDRLYTSNCSLKRAFLVEEEHLFSTKYRYAAYEDVELGYRLHLDGMVLRYIADAKGYHYHAMTPSSFVERQRKVGRMLTLLALQRPTFVGNEHKTFLRALEFLRSWPGAATMLSSLPFQSGDLSRVMAACYESLLNAGGSLGQPTGRPIIDQDRLQWQKWIDESGHHAWEAVNELTLRLGMAEEWSLTEADAEKARAWLLLLTLPRTVGFNGQFWKMPFAAPDFSAFLFPNSQLAYKVSKFLRTAPVVGKAVSALELSTAGQWLRALLTRKT